MTQEAATPDLTRDRLLDEAEKLFAEKGFPASSVREITSAAGAHLSAVNYHFGSKKKLYLAVFEERWIPRARRILAPLIELQKTSDPPVETIIRVLADSFINGFEDEEERMRHQQLIHREMNQPTEAFQIILQQATQPAFQGIEEMLRPWAPAGMDNEQLKMYIFSVLAQLLFFNFGRRMVASLSKREYDQACRQEVVEHIVSFTLFGLGGPSQAQAAPSPSLEAGS